MLVKKLKTEAKEGSVSVEHLHHFRCANCNKWWSIGDPSIAAKVLIKQWFCPWCGLLQKVDKR